MPSVDLPEAIHPEPSPLLPRHLVDLFLRPKAFFGGQLGLGRTPYLLLVCWCYGAVQVVDRIDQSIFRAELGRPRPGWEQYGPLVTESWLGFWLCLLVVGAAAGAAIWWIGGWWFALRLRWSGAEEPDPHLARLVMIYSAFVQAGPFVASYALSTLVYSNYLAAYSSEELYSVALLIFPFWSIHTSYTGARHLFGLSGWRVRTWFLILPIVVYVSAFGLVAAMLALVANAPAA